MLASKILCSSPSSSTPEPPTATSSSLFKTWSYSTSYPCTNPSLPLNCTLPKGRRHEEVPSAFGELTPSQQTPAGIHRPSNPRFD
jgi:hypothetical protein